MQEWRKKRRKLNKEIDAFKNTRNQGYIGSIFNAKSEEEKAEDQEEIDEFIKQKYQEFDEKYEEERKRIDNQPPILDISQPPPGMRDDWIQFKASIIIPDITIKLLDSCEFNNRLITKLETSGLI